MALHIGWLKTLQISRHPGAEYTATYRKKERNYKHLEIISICHFPVEVNFPEINIELQKVQLS